MRIIKLIVPLMIPTLFGIVYAPINRSWTVKTFGCGCPPLDLSFRFNANHFNGIVWLVIAGICTSVWVWLVHKDFKQMHRAYRLILGGGVVIIIVTCMREFSLGYWL